MRLVYGLILLPLLATGQPSPGPGPAGPWSFGLRVGTALGAQLAYQRGAWLALARARYWWRGPAAGPGSSWLDRTNTRSRQTEVGMLAGRSLAVGRGLVYGAAGLAWVGGRQLGDYRYSKQYSSLLGDTEYVFAYRRYQALGLPLEIGAQTAARKGLCWGLALQADLNPQRSVYCALLTMTFGQAQ